MDNKQESTTEMGDIIIVEEKKKTNEELKNKAIKEIENVLRDILNLWPEKVFVSFTEPFNTIFSEDWYLGGVGCPSLTSDKEDKLYNELYKVFADTYILCSVDLYTENVNEAAEDFLDAMFDLDPTIGLNLQTNIAGINNRHNANLLPSFSEYAIRQM